MDLPGDKKEKSKELREAEVAFSELWADEEGGGLMAFLPVINTILLVLMLIMLYFKK